MNLRSTWLFLMALMATVNVAWADLCPLGVAPGVLNKAQVEMLKTRGYGVRELPGLDFTSVKRGLYVPNQTKYGLDFANGSWRFFFENRGHNGSPLVQFSYTNLNVIPSCDGHIAAMKRFGVRRGYAERALKYFTGGVYLGVAMIYAEATYFELTRQTFKESEAIQGYRKLLTSANTIVQGKLREMKKTREQLSHDEFLVILDEVRIHVFEFGLQSYVKGQASLTYFFSERSANCVGQSKILLALYHDLGLKPREGWQFGAEVYTDHVRPVLVNIKAESVIDLVYNHVNPGLVNPILTPHGLLAKTIEGALRVQPGLRFPWEKFTLKDSYVYAYLLAQDRELSRDLWTMVGMEPEPSPRTPPETQSAELKDTRQVTILDAFTKLAYAKGEVPESADLSAYMKRGYQVREREVADLGGGTTNAKPEDSDIARAIEFAAEMSDTQIAQLLPADRARYSRMKTGKVFETDLMENGFAAVKGIARCQIEGNTPHLLLPPITIEMVDDIGFEFANYRLTRPRSAEAIVKVTDQRLFQELSRLSVMERYNWLHNDMYARARLYSIEYAPKFKELFAGADPIGYWEANQRDLRHGLEILWMLNIFNDFSFRFSSCATPEMIGAAFPPFKNITTDVKDARLAFARKVATQPRSLIRKMSRLSEASLVDFLDFMMAIEENNEMFKGATDLSERVQAAGPDIARAYANSMKALLQKMLFDPEILFTPSDDVLVESSKILEDKTAFEIPEKNLPPISLLVNPEPIECPPEGGYVPSGLFFVHCKPKPLDTTALPPGAFRRVEHTQPMMLVGLMRNAQEAILTPSWALMIFNAWRPEHDEAFKRLDARFRSNEHRQNRIDAAKASGFRHVTLDILEYTDYIPLYHMFLDGLLSPYLPYIQVPDGPMRMSSAMDRISIQSQLDFQRAQTRADQRPVWIGSNELLENAYAYYLKNRPLGARNVEAVAKERQSLYDAYEDFEWSWTSHSTILVGAFEDSGFRFFVVLEKEGEITRSFIPDFVMSGASGTMIYDNPVFLRQFRFDKEL